MSVAMASISGGQVGLVQAIAVGPLGHRMRIEQSIRADLGLVALDVLFDGIGISGHARCSYCQTVWMTPQPSVRADEVMNCRTLTWCLRNRS